MDDFNEIKRRVSELELRMGEAQKNFKGLDDKLVAMQSTQTEVGYKYEQNTRDLLVSIKSLRDSLVGNPSEPGRGELEIIREHMVHTDKELAGIKSYQANMVRLLTILTALGSLFGFLGGYLFDLFLS